MRVRAREAAPARPGRGGGAFTEALERCAGPGGGAPCRPPADPAVPELREAARAIPAAIWAGRLEGGEALELAFGPELAVLLRKVPGGVELILRAGPSLLRAARVDLPPLLAALRERGVTVARAEVRPGSHAGAGPGAPAVDARPPLR